MKIWSVTPTDALPSLQVLWFCRPVQAERRRAAGKLLYRLVRVSYGNLTFACGTVRGRPGRYPPDRGYAA